MLRRSPRQEGIHVDRRHFRDARPAWPSRFPLSPLVPFEAGGAILEESCWREPMTGAEHGVRGSRHRAVALERDARKRAYRMHCHAGPLSHRRAGAHDHSNIALDESKQLFEGSLPPGTILVSAPGQRLRVRVKPPFDFLHFHVANRLLQEEGFAPDEDDLAPCDEFRPFRDTLAEALGRSLLEEDAHRSQPEYAKVVAKAIIMRAIGRREAKRRCWALPKWRMKRLELVSRSQHRPADQPG